MGDTKPAMSLQRGETFLVETNDESFWAVVDQHMGRGLVHGQIELRCHRQSSTDEKFTYSINYKTPVQIND